MIFYPEQRITSYIDVLLEINDQNITPGLKRIHGHVTHMMNVKAIRYNNDITIVPDPDDVYMDEYSSFIRNNKILGLHTISSTMYQIINIESDEIPYRAIRLPINVNDIIANLKNIQEDLNLFMEPMEFNALSELFDDINNELILNPIRETDRRVKNIDSTNFLDTLDSFINHLLRHLKTQLKHGIYYKRDLPRFYDDVLKFYKSILIPEDLMNGETDLSITPEVAMVIFNHRMMFNKFHIYCDKNIHPLQACKILTW